MLERLVEQREAVSLVLSDVTTVKNLNSHQWVTAHNLAVTLRPFMDVTELMSAASYPTLSMILPVLDGLKHLLETTSGGLDGLRAIFLRLLGEKFGDVFADAELCVATVVDPRFKLAPFDTDDRRQKATSAVLDAMQGIAAVQQPPLPPATAVANPTPSSSRSTHPSIWDKLDRGAAAATATSTRTQGSVQHELDIYTSDPPIPRSACALQWWKANRTSYPVIAELARRLLSVPATSVASERLFSRAGDVITKKRNQLSPSQTACGF